jgi:hypothetical protein
MPSFNCNHTNNDVDEVMLQETRAADKSKSRKG